MAMDGLLSFCALALLTLTYAADTPTQTALPSPTPTPVRPSTRNNAIAIGLSVPGGIILIAIVIWYYRYRRRKSVRKPSAVSGKFDTSRPYDDDQRSTGGEKATPSNSKAQLALDPPEDPVFTFMNNSHDVAEFYAFLKLYGSEGVVLRELVMLASIRFPPDAENIVNDQWSFEKPAELGDFLTGHNFLNAFGLCANRAEDLSKLGNLLIRRSLIKVKPGSKPECAIEDQIWISGNAGESIRFRLRKSRREFCKSLIQIFSVIPGNAYPSLKDRRIDAFYDHARVFQDFITAKVKPENGGWKEWLQHPQELAYINLMLNLLIHQFEPREFIDLDRFEVMLRAQPIDSSLYPQLHLKIMWARFWLSHVNYKDKTGSKPLVSYVEDLLQLELNTLSPTLYMNGMVGLFLNTTLEVLKQSRATTAIQMLLKTSEEWCDEALKSTEPLQLSAICKLLPQTRCWEKLAKVPPHCHLDIGFNLSRSGFVRLAERYIQSGLLHVGSAGFDTLWRYGVEQLTVMIQLGNWDEAQTELANMIWLHRSSERGELTEKGFTPRSKLTGDMGERALALTCTLSDIYLKQGRLAEAERLLRGELCRFECMRDQYLRSIRIAIRSRLLKIQVHLGDFSKIKRTCLEHHDDVALLYSSPQKQNSSTASWAVEEILTCADELADSMLYSDSSEILSTLENGDVIRKWPPPFQLMEYLRQRLEKMSKLSKQPSIDRAHAIPKMTEPADKLSTSIYSLPLVQDEASEHQDNAFRTDFANSYLRLLQPSAMDLIPGQGQVTASSRLAGKRGQSMPLPPTERFQEMLQKIKIIRMPRPRARPKSDLELAMSTLTVPQTEPSIKVRKPPTAIPRPRPLATLMTPEKPERAMLQAA